MLFIAANQLEGSKSALRVHDLQKRLRLPESFAEAHVPIRQHLGDGVYLLANGDLGVVYRLSGIYDEPMTNEALGTSLHGLMKFMRQMSLGIPSYASHKNTVIQLICSQREVASPPKKHVDGEEYDFSTSDSGKLLRAEESLLFKLGIVRRDFLVAVRFSPKRSASGALAKIGNWVDLFKGDNDLKKKERAPHEAALREFESVLRPLELELASSRPLTRLPVAELVGYYENVLHGGNAQSLVFPRDEAVQEGIYNPELSGGPEGIFIESGAEIRPFVLSQLPAEYSPGMFRHFVDALPLKNFDLVWCFSHGTREFGQSLTVKSAWFSRGPAHKSKHEDLVQFQENIDGLRPQGIQSLRLLTYGIDEPTSAMVQTLAMDHIGARMVPERQIGVHMVVSSLPLCLSREGNKIVGRSSTIRLENAQAFWPIYDAPPAEYGTRWRVSRNMMPTRCDLFAGEGNRMTTVLGTSGAGKSVEMNQLFLEFMDRYPNGVIMVLDKKTSYLKLADLMGGKIVSFSEEALRKSPYSPFALSTWNEDDIESLYVLLATALVQKNPGIEMTSLHTEILRDALKIAFNNQLMSMRYAGESKTGDEIDPHPIWPNVLAALPVASNLKAEAGVKGAEAAREDLAAWSVSLGESGQYGFVFSRHERKESATAGTRFLVYDLDGIPDPVLQLLAGQMAFLKISRDLSRLPRSTPKLVVFEELGILLHGDSAAQKLNEEFIQNVVKTCRKLNAQGVSLTNGVSDYADKPAGRTLWTIATQKIFLPLGSSMVTELEEKFPGEFDEAEIQILRSLEINRKLKRSEIYVRSENSDAPHRGTMLSPLSPVMDALVTTSGSQMELYQRLRNEGLSAADALKHMFENFPYGQRLVRK